MNATNLKVSMQILSEKGHIDITWTEFERHSEFLRFDIVRKKASVPAHYFDGKVVYSGTDTEFSDTDIKNGVIYYYRLFVVIREGENYNTDYLTDARCIVKTIAFGSNILSYGDRLYTTLPDQVLEDDKRQEKEYPLRRFFRLLFTEFDKLEVINDTILDQLDVEICDEAILPLHARWLGLEYDYNFDVATNRLLLGTWREIQPYQGTETGVRYFLQKVFKSEVKITVDKKVNIVIITLTIDDSRYWMINSVDKINKMIKAFLALRTKYDLTIKLGPIEENFDHDRFDEYTFDIVMFAPDDEWYQNRDGGFGSEEYLLSYTLFFSDKAPNRIKDELIEYIKMDLDAADEVYSLDKPLSFGSSNFLLSYTLYFATTLRETDELWDKFITEYAERYAKMQKKEWSLDVARVTDKDNYDRRDMLGNAEYLLSSTLFFATGDEFPANDNDSYDNVSEIINEQYELERPDVFSSQDSLLGTMLFGIKSRDTDKLYDSIVEISDDVNRHPKLDNVLDNIITHDADVYNESSLIGRELLSDTMMFASVPRLNDELSDKFITEGDEQYFITFPLMMFGSGLFAGGYSLGYSEINPPDEHILDKAITIDCEPYSRDNMVDELGLTTVQDNIGNEPLYAMGMIGSVDTLMGSTFTFGRANGICRDELVDVVHYVRPVGLLCSAEALLGSSMYMGDNLI